MKMIGISFALFFGLCTPAMALSSSPSPMVDVGAVQVVSVSTYVFTNVTLSTHTRMADMSGVLVGMPLSASASMFGHIGNCTSTSVSTVTARGPVEVTPGASGVVGLSEGLCLWLVSLHTAAENIYIQGFRQRK